MAYIPGDRPRFFSDGHTPNCCGDTEWASWQKILGALLDHASPAPSGEDHIVTEEGDTLITEEGDTITVE